MLDKHDIEILKILRENARKSISEIAKELKISRPTVKAKIDRLIKEGIIKKFTIEISDDFIEKGLTLHIRAKADSADIMEELKNLDAALEVYEIAHEKNIFIKAKAGNINEVKSLLADLRKAGLNEIDCGIELSEIKKSKEIDFLSAKLLLKCEYCGKEIKEKPHIFKLHNREHYFCCDICLKSYRKKVKYSRIK